MVRDAMDAGRPPALVRLSADVLDTAIAVAIVLLAQVAARFGLVDLPVSDPVAVVAFGPPAVGAVLVLLALRDVPAGASFAKWLLGLRVVGRDGRRLALPLRILRAPLSVPPLEWVAESSGRLPWRVERYVPSAPGLALRGALGVVAAGWTLWWGVQSVRPTVGGRDAARLAQSIVDGDPSLARELGAPLEFEVGHIVPRSRAFFEPDTGEFELRIIGAHRRQEMTVRALRVDGRWVVDEIVDIEIAALATPGRDTLAVR